MIMFDFNSVAYRHLLNNILKYKADENSHGIEYELLNAKQSFDVDSYIDCAITKYIEAELDWYLSQDLCIAGHKLIETNKVWSNICSDGRIVNSNYGWCIFSKANGNQYENVVKHLMDDKSTKHACMYYTRPAIHREYNDNKHAKYDMICTIYTNHFIRHNKLFTTVHMRSSDAWNGVRNDHAWHIYVYNKLYAKLTTKYADLKKGNITFIADSMHIYKRDVDKVYKYLNEAQEAADEQ